MTDPLTLAVRLEQRASELAVVYPHMIAYADSMREASAAIRALILERDAVLQRQCNCSPARSIENSLEEGNALSRQP